ncbi:MAG: DUF262 domain-containing protein [Candidatus Hydrogenedentes bacterium]|nr:DUF262 domain-containing protein [Candidatus Hydrogenedentota bacterium]
MAKSVLLNTDTRNFLDLIGNGRVYRVPPYQRDYSWQKEQWEDLWNDILELRNDADARHYMGALVVEGKSDREYEIIDGQQRLATLSIIALAILARLGGLAAEGVEPEDNTTRATDLRKRFIGERDPASLVESSKLFLNENDNGFYQDYLVQLRTPANARGLSASNGQLWKCFQYYEKSIRAESNLADSGRGLATLLNECIGRQLLFILITVDDEINAYTVFETLNARGLELSATDLLKNYLFSLVKARSDLDSLQRRWKSLVSTVRQERFPEFLRYHLLCELPKVRTQRLFKIVRDRISSPADVLRLMDELEQRSELFSALGDPGHEYWIDDPACRPYIQELKLFGVRQFTPVLYAAWEMLRKNEFARVLKLISRFAFRYTVVAGLNTNELEPVCHHAAKALLDGLVKSPAELFARLQPIYVEREPFIQAFASMEISTKGPRKRLVRYVLCALEQDASGRACDYLTDPATIEHILPENPDETWDSDFPQDRRDRYTYRLGNLTLLESGMNRQAGNSPYPDKVGAYAGSAYQLTKRISDMAPEEWTPERIALRQRKLAERAEHLWRSDFATD